MKEKLIPREDLLDRLKRTAQVRSALSMLLGVPISFWVFTVYGEALGHGLTAIIFFGAPVLVMLLITELYCKRAVRCPHCGSSLWHCGTDNFKPRRMKIGEDAEGCRRCGAELAPARAGEG